MRNNFLCQHKLSKKLTFWKWLLPHYAALEGKVKGEKDEHRKRKTFHARKTLRLWKTFLPPKAVSHLVLSHQGKKRWFFEKTFKFEYLRGKSWVVFLSREKFVSAFWTSPYFHPQQTSFFFCKAWKFSAVFAVRINTIFGSGVVLIYIFITILRHLSWLLFES